MNITGGVCQMCAAGFDHETCQTPGMSPDMEAWAELWHAMKGVTIVGHPPGGPCPYQVGHTMREHFLLGQWPTVEARLQAVIDAGLHLESKP